MQGLRQQCGQAATREALAQQLASVTPQAEGCPAGTRAVISGASLAHVWKDLLADAMHEAVVDEAVVGCRGADARGAGWRSGQKAAPAAAVAAVAAASAGLPSPPLVVQDEEEALAALHAALSRSTLWRRHRARQELQRCPGPGAAEDDHAPQGAVTNRNGMEETTAEGEQVEEALFVRLGLPYGCASSGVLGSQPRQGDREGSGVAAEPQPPSVVALDLAFVSQSDGMDLQGSGESPADAKPWFDGSGCGHVVGGNGGGSGRRISITGAPVPSCLRTLLAELVVRQDDDTGIARALACTLPSPRATAVRRPGGGSAHSGHGGRDWMLCRALAPLLVGNTSPNVVAVLADGRDTTGTAGGAGARSNPCGMCGRSSGREPDVEF